jgi:hypothetical protein
LPWRFLKSTQGIEQMSSNETEENKPKPGKKKATAKKVSKKSSAKKAAGKKKTAKKKVAKKKAVAKKAPSKKTSAKKVSKKKATPRKKAAASAKVKQISYTEYRERVALAAYFIAERRLFENGLPEQDWLEAEAQVDAELKAAGIVVLKA